MGRGPTVLEKGLHDVIGESTRKTKGNWRNSNPSHAVGLTLYLVCHSKGTSSEGYGWWGVRIVLDWKDVTGITWVQWTGRQRGDLRRR